MSDVLWYFALLWECEQESAVLKLSFQIPVCKHFKYPFIALSHDNHGSLCLKNSSALDLFVFSSGLSPIHLYFFFFVSREVSVSKLWAK